jgi:hypothetical protein
MSSTASRWSAPVSVSGVFTEEQSQRVQALRAAREVVEERGAASPFAAGPRTADYWQVLEVAQWIIDGTMPVLISSLPAEGVAD